MHISLIGMAGSGKSYWSKKLMENGFRRFCCDDRIEEKLTPQLVDPDGTRLEMGSWMGFPWEPTYGEREITYLSTEGEVLLEIVHYLTCRASAQEHVVVDTTGSVIYADEQVLDRLRRLTIMVYLPVPVEFRASLLEAYRVHPHPLVWHGIFARQPGESKEEALSRCYPHLISSRERLYERYAQVQVDFHQRRQDHFDAHQFLALIEEARESLDPG